MSMENNYREASRWIHTAKDDYKAAQVLEREMNYAHACFFYQQAAEKAVKGLYYLKGIDPWGHSIAKLIDRLKDVDETFYIAFSTLRTKGLVLDRYYIPTRYPNGLPDLIPSEAFTESDARQASEDCLEILNTVFKYIPEQKDRE